MAVAEILVAVVAAAVLVVLAVAVLMEALVDFMAELLVVRGVLAKVEGAQLELYGGLAEVSHLMQHRGHHGLLF
jgi:hypothetical protein